MDVIFGSPPLPQTLDSCEDCYTEALDCNNKFCSVPVEGALNDLDSIVGIIDDVEDEQSCEGNCQGSDSIAENFYLDDIPTFYVNTI